MSICARTYTQYTEQEEEEEDVIILWVTIFGRKTRSWLETTKRLDKNNTSTPYKNVKYSSNLMKIFIR